MIGTFSPGNLVLAASSITRRSRQSSLVRTDRAVWPAPRKMGSRVAISILFVLTLLPPLDRVTAQDNARHQLAPDDGRVLADAVSHWPAAAFFLGPPPDLAGLPVAPGAA